MILLSLKLYLYQVPLNVSLPVGKQRIDKRHGLVLHAVVGSSTNTGAESYSQTHSQTNGQTKEAWVDIAPLSGLDIDDQPISGFSRESLLEVQQTLTEMLPKLCGQSIDILLQQAEAVNYPSLAFGLSLLHAKLAGKLDGVRSISATVPLIYQPVIESGDAPASQLEDKVASLGNEVRSVKVKVAQTSMEDELRLIYGILKVRPDLKLRLDANRGFSFDEAMEFAACLPMESIEYIEEPCQHPKDNSALFQALNIPFALDESLNDSGYHFAMHEGLTALIIKPMLLGSIEKLQNLIDTAQQFGVRCILSSSLESSLGLSDLASLAAILTPDEIPGLDTLSAFSQDVLVPSGKSQCLGFEQLELIASAQQE
ncbi:o-succinylbenzoate synthase [Shewanella acanthi]|uniref:o-succinylbenzoate synthase n=1 Tax=Shewanella acanthi TaxID=2864212 RepID=UPI001C661F7C|nr:o-succinylbenzoate synthase [Shewanella acanthi]QYJ78679.1 o-succinylbenzoate synthase [Shewanella acanthi]